MICKDTLLLFILKVNALQCSIISHHCSVCHGEGKCWEIMWRYKVICPKMHSGLRELLVCNPGHGPPCGVLSLSCVDSAVSPGLGPSLPLPLLDPQLPMTWCLKPKCGCWHCRGGRRGSSRLVTVDWKREHGDARPTHGSCPHGCGAGPSSAMQRHFWKTYLL